MRFPEQELKIDYTNWRGERRERLIQPLDLYFTSDQWHTTPQWLIRAVDVEKGEVRNFAVLNIHSFTAA